MKWNKILIFSFLAVFFWACGATQKIVEPNTELETMIMEKSFEIQARTAQPQPTQAMTQIANSGLIQQGNSINRIDLGGTGYYLKVKGDSVSANLPFWGERRMGGGYNTRNSGINFDGLAKNFETIKNEENASYIVKFSVSDKTEIFNVTANISNNTSSLITIWSSHRNQIRYSGNTRALEEE